MSFDSIAADANSADPMRQVDGAVTSFNLYSMIVAIIGAIFVLLIYHAVFGRKVT
jgi:uncharacterized membrane protein YeaQ/YmgE (transglycosylase-associated protein family)